MVAFADVAMRNGATRFNGGQDELLDTARKLFAERICCKSTVLSPFPHRCMLALNQFASAQCT